MTLRAMAGEKQRVKLAINTRMGKDSGRISDATEEKYRQVLCT